MAIDVVDPRGRPSNGDAAKDDDEAPANGDVLRSASIAEGQRVVVAASADPSNDGSGATAPRGGGGGGGGAFRPGGRHARFLPVVGLFGFYIAHDALQERMFRFDGFGFGFFMTLVEVVVMLVGSVLGEGDSGVLCSLFFRCAPSRRGGGSRGRRSSLSSPTLVRIGLVGLFLALAHGLGNTSLNYSPYPLKVAFKSSKLVPTMALGACVTGKKFTALQYAAALVMGMGLAVLTAADVFDSKRKVPLDHGVGADSEWSRELGPFVGPILLAISTVFDSIIPNLQEQLLQTARVKTSEMILISNLVMCVVLVAYTTYSGELRSAWEYCAHNGKASGLLLCQGLSAYLGLRCYLAIIRDHGGVVGVLLANGRKVMTIILSFVLFAKPFNERHVVGLVLVFAGVYLGYVSKKGKKGGSKKDGMASPGRNRIRKGRKRRERIKSSADGSRDHTV